LTVTEGLRMNERIKELAEQSEISQLEYNSATMMTSRIQEFDKEKFAELIVRECAKFLDDNSGLYICNNVGSPTSKKLLQHFGIEE
jgi:hypothetical protein